MAKSNTAKVAKETPTTTVAGKVVGVTGTKGGAISAAATAAKATRLKGAPAPTQAGKYAGTQALKVLDATNPHRPGTYRFKAFDAAVKCKTAGDYAATGYKVKYLARWVQLGLIRIS